jgi:6-pyruvoyl-tetrahydropterin synthase
VSSHFHTTASFDVFVSKETFKFNAAHFIAYPGFRERLHGHNYRLGVRLQGGSRLVGGDGYLIDFGCVKEVCKRVCKRLNETFLCPMYSNALNIVEEQAREGDDDSNSNSNSNDNHQMLRIECHHDRSYFIFPKRDCSLLPIVHSSTEELAIYLWNEILNDVTAEYLRQRGIHTMEVTVAEAENQQATFRLAIPSSDQPDFPLDVRDFISNRTVGGEVNPPPPCIKEERSSTSLATAQSTTKTASTTTTTTSRATSCCPDCQASQARFTQQLQQIAAAINAGSLLGSGTTTDATSATTKVTVEDLTKLIQGMGTKVATQP